MHIRGPPGTPAETHKAREGRVEEAIWLTTKARNVSD
jgi:hypothetical protein